MNTLKVIYKHSMHLIPQNKVKENSGKAFAILQKKNNFKETVQNICYHSSSVDYQAFR